MSGFSDEDLWGAPQTPSGLSDADVWGAPKQQPPVNLFAAQPAEPKRTALGLAQDVGVTAAKSVVGTGEALVGLANIPTFGYAGKLLHDTIGFDPKEAQSFLSEGYSDAQQAANKRVEDAKGFIPTVQALYRNPSTIATGIGESLGPMFLGGGIGRGIGLAAKYAPYAGAIGEGLVGAGSAAEQIRQESADQKLSGNQVLASLGSGVGTGVLGAVGGKVANKLGLGDVDTALATAARDALAAPTKRGLLARMFGGAISEGVLEELPQSIQEQMWQNYATNKPILEGVPEAAAKGLVTGGVMGGGFNIKGQNQGIQRDLTDTTKPADLLQLPAPTRTGTPSDQLIQQATERANAVADAERANAQLWNERAAYENRDQPVGTVRDLFTRVPFAPPLINTAEPTHLVGVNNPNQMEMFDQHGYVNEPQTRTPDQALIVQQQLRGPQRSAQEQINQLTGVGGTTGITRQDFIADDNKGSGVWVNDANGLERELTIGEWKAVQTGATNGTSNSNAAPGVAPARSAQASDVVSGSATDLVGGRTGISRSAPAAVPTVPANPAQQSNAAAPASQASVAKGTKENLKALVSEQYPVGSEEHTNLINAIDEAKTYAQARTRMTKSGMEGMRIALRSMPETDAAVVMTAMGMDKDGAMVEAPPSYVEVGKRHGISDSGVNAVLKKYSITRQVIDRMAAVQQEPVAVSEFLPGQAEDGSVGSMDDAGFSVLDRASDTKVVEAPSANMTDEERAIAVRNVTDTAKTDKAMAEQGISPKELAQPSNFQTAAEVRGEEVARANREAAAAAERNGFIQEVAADYNDSLMDGDVQFADMDVDLQERYIEVYADALENKINAQAVMRAWSEIADEAKSRRNSATVGNVETPRLAGETSSVQEASQGVGNSTQSSEGTTDGEVNYSELASTSNTVSYFTATPAETRFFKSGMFSTYLRDFLQDAGLSWWQRPDVSVFEGQIVVPSQDVKTMRAFAEWLADAPDSRSEIPPQMRGHTFLKALMSAKTGDAAQFSENQTGKGSKAPSITATLKKLFFSPAKFDQLVSIVQSLEALPAQVKASVLSQAKNPQQVQGFVGEDGKVYLIADNIAPGAELAVFLHEVGVHLGMEKLIGKANMAALVNQINTWADKNDGSQEGVLAKAALDRAKNSSSKNKTEEVMAYFIEEAVKAGVDPYAVSKVNSPLAQWFRSLWAAAKVALRKIGMGRFDSLTAQDLVNLAYGAAKLEMTGTWHGTAADYRNFNHKYMGTGEGAQAYGWGTYLAQRVGIGKGYWKADTQRKSRNPVRDIVDLFAEYQGGKLAENLYDPLTGEEVAKAGMVIDKMNAYELAHDAVAYGFDAIRVEPLTGPAVTITIPEFNKNAPEGSLMRVDHSVNEDEMLDWDKPFSAQSELVQKALYAKLSAKLLEEAVRNKYTGQQIYRRLERALGSDKAASQYLDSIGIKGVKHLDAMSRTSNADKPYNEYPGKSELNAAIEAEDRLGFDTHGEVRAMLLQDGVAKAKQNYDFSDKLATEAQKYLDWRAETPPQTRNHIIFNDKNVQRVMTEVGANPDKIKFSDDKSASSSTMDTQGAKNGQRSETGKTQEPGTEAGAASRGSKSNTERVSDWTGAVVATRLDEAESLREVQEIVDQLTEAQIATDEVTAWAEDAYEALGTKSPFFQRWFNTAGSAVRRADGSPMLLFHGAPVEFAEFDDNRRGSNTGFAVAALGHFFSDKKAVAEGYGVTRGFYLRLENPLVLRGGSIQHNALIDQVVNKGAAAVRAALVAKGYDGIVLDTRGIEGDRTFIVFSSKQNAIKTVENVGTFAESKDVYFSEASTPVEQAVRTTNAQVSADLGGLARTGLYNLAFVHDLVDIAKSVLPTAKKWYDTLQKIGSTRRAAEEAVERIANEAASLSKAQYDRSNKFLSDSTTQEKWGYQPKWRNSPVAVDPAMAARWNALTPAERTVIDAVFEQGAINRQHDVAIDAMAGIRGEVGRHGNPDAPYAPLKRFGNYIVVAKSRALMDAYAAGNEKLVEQLKADPAHYHVEFKDTPGLAEQLKQELQTKFDGDVYATPKMEYFKQNNELDFKQIAKLKAALKIEGNLGKLGPAIDTMLNDMWLSSLAENNARQSKQARTGVAGFDSDMFRSFLANGRAKASFYSYMEHGADLNESMYKMQSEARGNAKGVALFNTFAEHYARMLQSKDTPWQNKALAVASFWQLLTSPAYYAQNLLQPAMLTVPILAGRFGAIKSWGALLDGYRALKDGFKGGTFDIDSHKNAGERAMMKVAQMLGVLDIGLDAEMGRFDSTDTGYKVIDTASAGARKVTHALRQVARKAEIVNRVSSGIAAYKLAIADGQSQEAATEYAVSVLRQTQGDYSGVAAPLVIKRWPKIITQYRKFQIMQGTMLVRLFNEAVLNGNLSATEKAVARKQLAWTLGHAAVVGGAMGMPAMSLIAAAFGMGGGDDEPKDLERSLRELIGDSMWADLLLKGAPAAAGVDLSNRLGMANVFSALPYQRVDFTSKKGAMEAVAGVAGPFAGLAYRFADGAGLMKQGDYYKGLEMMLPQGLGNAAKAFRFANEGVTLRNNDLVLRPEEITFMDAFSQGLGLPDTKLSHRQWAQGQIIEAEKFFTEHSKTLQHKYVAAHREGDSEAMSELRDDWMKMQTARRENGFSVQPLSNLLKSPQAQAKRERSTVDGLEFKKSNRGFVRRVAELTE